MSWLMSNSSCEVGLLSLIGSGFQFGVNRFETEYLRKCAFWQRLQAGMYGACVSLEIGVGSLGSPLEWTPLLHPYPTPPQLRDLQYRGRKHWPDAKENISVALARTWSWVSWAHTHASEHNTYASTDIHTHTHNKKIKRRPDEYLTWVEKWADFIPLNIKTNFINDFWNIISSLMWNRTQAVEMKRKPPIASYKVVFRVLQTGNFSFWGPKSAWEDLDTITQVKSHISRKRDFLKGDFPCQTFYSAHIREEEKRPLIATIFTIEQTTWKSNEKKLPLVQFSLKEQFSRQSDIKGVVDSKHAHSLIIQSLVTTGG